MARALSSLLLVVFVVFLVACSSPPLDVAPAVASPSPGEAAASAEPLAATIDAYLAEKGSPLAGLGAEFVASGRRHDVDPRLVVAIAGAETSFGTRLGCYDSSGNVVANPYNAWNWFYKGGCPSPFASWGDGIDRVTAGLRRLYLDQGLESIEAIAEKYTATEREVWVENVRRIYQELGGDLGDLGYQEEGVLVLAPGQTPAPEVGITVVPATVAVPTPPPSLSVRSEQPDRFLYSLGVQAEVGEFNSPAGIAVAPDGSVYVADTWNHRVQRFDARGQFLGSWGKLGSGPGQFDRPWGIAVGLDGSVYVADTWNHRVQRFDAEGQFLSSWGSLARGRGSSMAAGG